MGHESLERAAVDDLGSRPGLQQMMIKTKTPSRGNATAHITDEHPSYVESNNSAPADKQQVADGGNDALTCPSLVIGSADDTPPFPVAHVAERYRLPLSLARLICDLANIVGGL